MSAPLVHRRYDPIAALFLAAAGMVLLDPDVLVDAGHQLSLLAMWGLVMFAPRLTTWLGKIRVPGVFAYPVAVGLSAQIATLPLLVVIAGQVSVGSLFATMTAYVTLVYLMMAGILTAAFGALGLGFLAWIGGMLTRLCAGCCGGSNCGPGCGGLHCQLRDSERGTQSFIMQHYLRGGLFSAAKRGARVAAIWPDLKVALLGATAAAVWTSAILLVVGE